MDWPSFVCSSSQRDNKHGDVCVVNRLPCVQPTTQVDLTCSLVGVPPHHARSRKFLKTPWDSSDFFLKRSSYHVTPLLSAQSCHRTKRVQTRHIGRQTAWDVLEVFVVPLVSRSFDTCLSHNTLRMSLKNDPYTNKSLVLINTNEECNTNKCLTYIDVVFIQWGQIKASFVNVRWHTYTPTHSPYSECSRQIVTTLENYYTMF